MALANITAKATDNSSNAASNSTTSAAIQLTVTAGVAQVYYIHTDQLGTPRLITDSNNAKVWEWRNDDPFGNNPPNENPSGLGTFSFNPRLPGQYADKETGTNYNYFRDYDPETGRYRESDPIGLQGGINTYGYVGGNPMSYSDPLGLNPLSDSDRSHGGFTPIPGPFDVFFPGTQANQNFVDATFRVIDKVKELSEPKASRADGEERLPIVNPGKDCNGNCKPCPPGKRWFVPKPGHGHENGYWHTIVYNQDKKTCMCYPDRPSGGLEGF